MLIHRSGQQLDVTSPAKLNLFLEITSRRDDGFHELETLMITIGLSDFLSFQEDDSSRIELKIVDARSPAGRNGLQPRAERVEPLPTDSRNLIVRAARLLQQETGSSQGARILLRKQIPAAAGLAGGSGNAAVTLLALNRLWNTGLSAGELAVLAAKLGSDLGFFLTGRGAAICRGRGELVEPVTLPAGLPFVLIKPAAGLSTQAVYRECRPAQQPRSAVPLVNALQRGCLPSAAARLYNALQSPAERLCPAVARLRERLARLPVAGHLMSGSGTTCFVLCRNYRQARSIAGVLRQEQHGMVRAVRSIPYSWPEGLSA